MKKSSEYGNTDVIDLILEHSKAIQNAKNITEIVKQSYTIFAKVLKFETGSFAFIQGDYLVHFFRWGNHRNKIHRMPLSGKGVSVRAARTGEIQYVPNIEEDQDYVYVEDYDLARAKTEFDVPILIDGKVYAVINLESVDPDAFTFIDRKLVEIIANQIGIAIKKLLVEEKIQRLDLEMELLSEEFLTNQEKAHLMDNQLSIASHEIRSPLTSILGYSEMTLDAINENNIESFTYNVNAIHRSALKISLLINNLLDMQKIEEDRLCLNYSVFPIKTLISNIVSEMEPILKKKRQTIDVEINTDKTEIRADSTRLNEVLVNLLNNASKFSQEDSIIHLDISEDDGMYIFKMKDNGIGLSKEDLQKIFKPFPEIQETSNSSGFGIGLVICKAIIEMHGGKIWAESKGKDKGTIFTFTIPY